MTPARWARVVLAAGLAGFLVYAFPGYLSFDSVDQLGQARAGHYTDWHPPAMALLWRMAEVFVAGPFAMLAIQVGCFVAGIYMLLARALTPVRAAAGTVALLWFPPIATTLAVIWKDSLMIGFLALGTALLVDGRRRPAIAGLAMLLLASAMRHNAFTITLPIVAGLFVWDVAARPVVRYALAVAAWVAITLVAIVGNKVLTDEAAHPWAQSVAMMDVAGTLRYAHVSESEAEAALAGMPLVGDHDQLARVRKLYDPAWMWNEIGDTAMFHHANTDAELDAIGRAWGRVVPAHLGAYLRYRCDVFAELLQIKRAHPGSSAYVWFTDVQDPEGSAQRVGHDASASALQARLQHWMQKLGAGWLFRPVVYLAFALALVWPVRRDRLAVVLLASALVSTAALVVLPPTPDFRYAIWLVVTPLLVALMTFARRTEVPA